LRRDDITQEIPSFCSLNDPPRPAPPEERARIHPGNTGEELLFVFILLRTLPFSVFCKSCICHSYENTRVYGISSHSGTPHSPARSIASGHSFTPSSRQGATNFFVCDFLSPREIEVCALLRKNRREGGVTRYDVPGFLTSLLHSPRGKSVGLSGGVAAISSSSG
jgi:hypothetical protein